MQPGRIITGCGLLLLVWGILLAIMGPDIVTGWLQFEPTRVERGTHFFLVGVFSLVPETIALMTIVPFEYYVVAGIVLVLLGFLFYRRQHPLIIIPREENGEASQGRKWKDPRTRLVDDLRRELRKLR